MRTPIHVEHEQKQFQVIFRGPKPVEENWSIYPMAEDEDEAIRKAKDEFRYTSRNPRNEMARPEQCIIVEVRIFDPATSKFGEDAKYPRNVKAV